MKALQQNLYLKVLVIVIIILILFIPTLMI
jgi:hypothetical protein